jgi:hypothetical protein
MWLRDFLPAQAPRARILTYGYQSKITGANLSIGTLRELAKRFLNNLISMRNDQRQVIMNFPPLNSCSL